MAERDTPAALLAAFTAGFQWAIDGTDRDGDYNGGSVDDGFGRFLATPAATPAGEPLEDMRARKDAAYDERNRVVAALSKLWPSHLARHPESDATWERDWMTIVCIHSPMGQLTWHVHDSQGEHFAHLNDGENHWDGHDTIEKYRRLALLPATPPAPDREARPRAIMDEIARSCGCIHPTEGAEQIIAAYGATVERETLERVAAERAEIIELLKSVRTLDCGAHYCRYCSAKSPKWEHSTGCPYVESQRESDAANSMIQRLRQRAKETR